MCQRTVSKDKVTRVPLESMPFIDEPFHRIAVDLIGPVTDKRNRYILTPVDYATRYPEAVALLTIETERVAKAVVDMFSRVKCSLIWGISTLQILCQRSVDYFL